MALSQLCAVIIGGGLGGLCLAQGLVRSGIHVEVYERDASLTSRPQGYRIHIDTRGVTPLRECLQPAAYELFDATRGEPGDRVTILTKRLRNLNVTRFPAVATGDQIGAGGPVNRLTLREILFAGLDNCVHFEKTFTHYEPEPDGSIRASFLDGTSVIGDVLVAADGVGSRIRQQYLPQAEVIDTGERCIYGKIILTEDTLPLLPDAVHHGFVGIVASRKLGMALGLMQFRSRPDRAAADIWPGWTLHPVADYLMWALSGQQEAFPRSDSDMRSLDGPSLQQIALNLTKDWHPNLRALIAQSVAADTFFLPIHTSIPIPPWPTTNVTLLGDAIHAMSPPRGSGANIALKDAGVLCRNLSAVSRGETPLLTALHDYERQMIDYGFAAVTDVQAVLRAGNGPLERLISFLSRHK
ncbi:MAG: FAD-dependent oxidoreductase [Thermomicrobiales bacterium]